MYKRILLGYDGSESGQQALLDSREIAQWSQAELVLVVITRWERVRLKTQTALARKA